MKKAASTNLLSLCFLAACLLGVSLPAMAQLRLVPLEKPSVQARQTTIQVDEEVPSALPLPFWDDFSFTGTAADTNLWENSPHVTVTNTIAVRPPSFNVATFDGIDATGSPYSQDPNLSAPSDTLRSRPIGLGPASVTDSEQASVYLSFYWQLQGRGNRPDSEDSLHLYFLDDNATWHVVWREGGREEIDSAAFQQELISLRQAGINLGTNFFHDSFRFMLVSSNRQSGQFDLWHVDYIYLDKNRSSTNQYYQDRTISDNNPSIFHPYTALPVEQYFANPAKYTRPEFSFTAFSLEASSQFQPMDYSIVSYDQHGDTLYEMAREREFPGFLFGQQYMEVPTEGLPADALDDYRDKDSLYITTLIKLFSQEERRFFNHNDTARIENVLHDYFAYDDGTAEYGIEVTGGRGLRIAIAFELEVRDTITHIDLYLPYFRQSLSGQTLDLKIWSRLGLEEGQTDSLLYTERDVILQNSNGLNTFTSYTLRYPQVLEPGTFYIGIEKRSDRYLSLGFDRNTDSRDKVFVSTDEENWFEGLDDAGSLMIRPRFQKDVDPDVLSSREIDHHYPVKLYPNPSKGLFRVESQALQLQVYSLQGQLIRSYRQEPGSGSTQLDLRDQGSGLYIVKLIFKDAIISKKVLIKP